MFLYMNVVYTKNICIIKKVFTYAHNKKFLIIIKNEINVKCSVFKLHIIQNKENYYRYTYRYTHAFSKALSSIQTAQISISACVYCFENGLHTNLV